MNKENQDQFILRGKTLKVYRYIVKSNESARVREIQRSVGFSSPSLVLYHIEKLKENGLIREEALGYVADKVLLKNLVRFRNALIPRFLVYFLFFIFAIIIELAVLLPNVVTREYVIAVFFTLSAAVAFGIETYRQWNSI